MFCGSYSYYILTSNIQKKRQRKRNVIKNMKNRNKNLGSLKNKVFFSGDCVTCLSFKAFFEPYFTAYILMLIFSLLLTSNINERIKQILLKL